MQGYRSFLLAQRLNDLSSQLADLEDLRHKVEEAERRASAVPALQVPTTTQSTPRKPTCSWRHGAHRPASDAEEMQSTREPK